MSNSSNTSKPKTTGDKLQEIIRITQMSLDGLDRLLDHPDVDESPVVKTMVHNVGSLIHTIQTIIRGPTIVDKYPMTELEAESLSDLGKFSSHARELPAPYSQVSYNEIGVVLDENDPISRSNSVDPKKGAVIHYVSIPNSDNKELPTAPKAHRESPPPRYDTHRPAVPIPVFSDIIAEEMKASAPPPELKESPVSSRQATPAPKKVNIEDPFDMFNPRWNFLAKM